MTDISLYRSKIASSILLFGKDLKGIIEMDILKIIAYTANNRNKIISLIESGKINDIQQLGEGDVEENNGTDLLVVKFSDSLGNKFVSLVYDSNDLWQDPEALDVIAIDP